MSGNSVVEVDDGTVLVTLRSSDVVEVKVDVVGSMVDVVGTINA